MSAEASAVPVLEEGEKTAIAKDDKTSGEEKLGKETAALDGQVTAGGDTGGSDDVQAALNAALQRSKATAISAEQLVSGYWKPGMYQGRLRAFNDKKGFGFIECKETMQEFGRDVFIHRAQMVESGIWVGQEVYFEVELNKQGHPQARSVQGITGGDGWDYSAGWGDGGMSGYAYGGYNQGGCGQAASIGGGSFGKQGSMGGYNKGMRHSGNARGQSSSASSMGGGTMSDSNAPGIEEMIRKCSGTSGMWEIIEQYGQLFDRKHVVIALYQLGLCRQHERRNGVLAPESRGLTHALIDRLVTVPAREFASDEISKTLWALGSMEEVREHSRAHKFCMELGQQVLMRYAEFSPSQMASFVGGLSKLIKDASEDELVGQITMTFSQYACGDGTLPRFPAEELRIWTNFLQDAVSPAQPSQQQQQQAAPGMQLGFMGMSQMPGPGLAAMKGMQGMQGMQGMGGMMHAMQGMQRMQQGPTMQDTMQMMMQGMQGKGMMGKNAGMQSMQSGVGAPGMPQGKGGAPGGKNLIGGPGKGMKGTAPRQGKMFPIVPPQGANGAGGKGANGAGGKAGANGAGGKPKGGGKPDAAKSGASNKMHTADAPMAPGQVPSK